MTDFCEVITTGSLEFYGEEKILPRDLVMVCFFTPDLKRYLAYKRMMKLNAPYDKIKKAKI